MSRFCDEPSEMPDDAYRTIDVIDDEAIEAIVHGRRPAGGGYESLVDLVRDVHAVADGPVPRPNAELSAVLMSGLSTEKGDLLVTAGSNVNGPAEQAAGLPKWRKQHSMLPTGILSGMAAKIAAGVAAALVGVTAAGAAGALPGPAQHAVASVVNAVTPLSLPDGNANASAAITTNVSNPTSPSADVDVDANAAGAGAGVNVTGGTGGANVNVTAGTNPTSHSNVGTGAGVNANVTTPTVPNLSNLPGGQILSSLPIPDCVKNIVNVKTGQPLTSLSQIAPQVISCVKSLLSTTTASLPTGTNDCVSSILGMLSSIGTNPGATPNLSGINFSKCIPVDITQCMSSISSMIQNFLPGGAGFGFGFGGSAGTGGASTGGGASVGTGIPGLSSINLQGCLPFNLNNCLSSLFSMAGNLPGVGTGGIPGLGGGTLPSVGDVNLAACIPTGSLSSIPGLSMLSGFLPH